MQAALPFILLVDDCPRTAAFVRQACGPGYQLIVAENAVDGFILAQRHSPELMLVALELKRHCALALVAMCKAVAGHGDMPVMVLARSTAMHDEVAALEAGAADFLRKPLHPDVFQARMGKLLATRVHHRRLRTLSSIDSLTGLYNRRYLDDCLGREVARQRRKGCAFGIAMLDIDYFKNFNDSAGHPAGDACLRALAAALTGPGTWPGEVATRWGGEEFCMVVPGLSNASMHAYGHALLERVRMARIAHPASPLSAYLTVSIGLAASDPDDPATPARLCGAADQALYAAKSAGRNRFHVFEKETQQVAVHGAHCPLEAQCV